MERARGDEMADPIEIITISDSESVDDTKASKGRRGGKPRTFVAKLQALRQRPDYHKRVFLLGNGDHVAGRHLTILKAKPMLEEYFENNITVISRTVELKSKWEETDLVVQLGKPRSTSGFAKGNDHDDHDFKDHPNFHVFDAAAIDEIEKHTSAAFERSKRGGERNYGRGGGAHAGGEASGGRAGKRAANNSSLSPNKRVRGDANANAARTTGGGRGNVNAERDAELKLRFDNVRAYVKVHKPRCDCCNMTGNYLYPVRVPKKNSVLLGCSMYPRCRYLVPPPAKWVDLGSMILSEGER